MHRHTTTKSMINIYVKRHIKSGQLARQKRLVRIPDSLERVLQETSCRRDMTIAIASDAVYSGPSVKFR